MKIEFIELKEKNGGVEMYEQSHRLKIKFDCGTKLTPEERHQLETYNSIETTQCVKKVLDNSTQMLLEIEKYNAREMERGVEMHPKTDYFFIITKFYSVKEKQAFMEAMMSAE